MNIIFKNFGIRISFFFVKCVIVSRKWPIQPYFHEQTSKTLDRSSESN